MVVHRPHGQARRLLVVLMAVLAAALLLLASSTATAYVLPALPSGSARSAGSTAVSSPPSIKSPLWGARRRSHEPMTRHKVRSWGRGGHWMGGRLG